MTPVPGPTESTGDETQYVNRAELSHEEAAKLLNDTLMHVNANLEREGKSFRVLYYGQPHLGTKAVEHPTSIDPMYPLDLALAYEGGSVEPIDIIDVVNFDGYDAKIGRQTTGFMAIETFAKVILTKIEQHLACKENPHVLISPVSGTKYSVEKLTGHTFAIDPQNYIFLDGYRVVYFLDEKETKPKALAASSLRSSGIMQVGTHEFADRLYVYESGDPAPRFYFDLSKIIEFAKELFPANQQKDLGSKDSYYVLRRDPGKI